MSLEYKKWKPEYRQWKKEVERSPITKWFIIGILIVAIIVKVFQSFFD